MFKFKVFVTMLIASCLIGCTKVENNVQNENNVISFMKATKVAQTKGMTAFDKEKTFNVYGLYSGDNGIKDVDFSNLSVYMNDVNVAYSDNEWKPVTTYYWPKNGKLSFIGYAPESAGIKLGNSLDAILNYEDYEVEHAYDAQTSDEDLLISKITKDNSRMQSPVYIEFKHALSQVKLSFKAAKTEGGDDNLKYSIVIDDAAINGIFNHGDFEHNSLENKNLWDVLNSYDRINSGDIIDNESGDALDGSANYFGTDEKPYYVLPQTFDDEMVLHIKYTIYTYNEDGVLLSEVEYEDDVVISKFGGSEWASGKSYIYNITINPESEDPITFDPWVVDWDEEYSADIDPDNEDAESEEEEEDEEEEEAEEQQGDNEEGDAEEEEQQGGNDDEESEEEQGEGGNQEGGNENQGDNQQGDGDNNNQGGKNNNGNGNDNGQDKNHNQDNNGEGNNSGKK